MRLAILTAVLTSMAASAADRGKPLDAKLTSSSGAATRLSHYWGKPMLLFYEDIGSVKLNQAAKDELKRLAELYHLRDVVDLVAVAALEGFNWEPARFFALAAVRGEEAKAKIPVLVDLTGELSKAPWNLSGHTSTLLIISPTGELLYEASGKIEGERLELLVSTLRGILELQARSP